MAGSSGSICHSRSLDGKSQERRGNTIPSVPYESTQPVVRRRWSAAHLSANGEWHPATSGYVAAPGDVAVYGLSLGADPSAVHVAIVTDDPPGQPGPDVVNGDRTGFSVVETGTNQVWADAGHDDFIVAGYVSPP